MSEGNEVESDCDADKNESPNAGRTGSKLDDAGAMSSLSSWRNLGEDWDNGEAEWRRNG